MFHVALANVSEVKQLFLGVLKDSKIQPGQKLFGLVESHGISMVDMHSGTVVKSVGF